MNDFEKILSPYKLNSLFTLKNKIVMAPMTRRFADENRCPIGNVADYYAKRSDCGLIITEGTLISEDAIGYGNVPGIYSEKQIEAWRNVTSKVHKDGGLIFMQLWHCGRVSHPNFHKGRLPISPSPTLMNTPLGGSGFNCGKSREATIDEINNLILDYKNAAINAIKAGFDGVELHGANGYLIDQFLHYCSNHRSDAYGGSPENMSKFCLEVINACVDSIGKDRVGIRLSPAGHMAEIETDPRDKYVFKYLFGEIDKIGIAYLHLGNFDDTIKHSALEDKTMTIFTRENYFSTLITSGGYNLETSINGINSKDFDLVALGRPFLANPDLIKKISNKQEWKSYEPSLLSKLI